MADMSSEIRTIGNAFFKVFLEDWAKFYGSAGMRGLDLLVAMLEKVQWSDEPDWQWRCPPEIAHGKALAYYKSDVLQFLQRNDLSDCVLFPIHLDARQTLVKKIETLTPPPPRPPRPPPPKPRDIFIFIDGTWNSSDFEKSTNVRKLFEHLTSTPADNRHCLYLPGVGRTVQSAEIYEPGSAVPRNFNGGEVGRLKLPIQNRLNSRLAEFVNRAVEGGSGLGTWWRIKFAYQFLCRRYRKSEGDRVFVFGFSRGAFAARSLVGFISTIGILFEKNLDYLHAAYCLYERRATNPHVLAEFVQQLTDSELIVSSDDPSSINVNFLGVWDTVGALGLPSRNEFCAPYTEFHQVTLPPNVFAARHAMALHEFRESFPVMLWENSGKQHADLKQRWFPGNHCDIGGGHPLHEAGLSDLTLEWMVQEAVTAGMPIEPLLKTNHLRKLHQETKWHRVPGLLGPAVREQLGLMLAMNLEGWEHAAYIDPSTSEYLGREAYTGKLRSRLQPCFDEVSMHAIELMRRNSLT